MFGSLPSLIHLSSRCGSIPSKPRMTSFFVKLDAGRAPPPEQASPHSAAPTTAIARAFTDLRMEMRGIITPCHGDAVPRRPFRAPASRSGAGVHGVRRRLAGAGDRRVHGDLL